MTQQPGPVEACMMGEEPLPPMGGLGSLFVFKWGCRKCLIKAQAEAVRGGDPASTAIAEMLEQSMQGGQP